MIVVPSVSVIILVVLTIFCMRRRSKHRKSGLFPPLVEGAIQPFLVSNNGTAPPPYCKVDVARRMERQRDTDITAVIINDELKTDS